MKPESSEPAGARQRQRVAAVLLAGVATATTGLIAAMTVAALAAAEMLGAATWSGTPVAASVLGTAVGTSLLAEAMRRFGRRRGLIASYGLAAIGALLSVLATARSWFPLLVAGMLTTGIGHAANPLTRYLLGDLYPASRRASALSWSVWAGTIGAVLGPNLIGPAGRTAVTLGLPVTAGAFLAATILFAGSALLYLLLLRPDPAELAVQDSVISAARSGSGPPPPSLLQLFRLPRIQIAVLSLIIGQVVMVLIMTMTPVEIRRTGLGLDAVGRVISAHIVGMFVLAPLTGRLVDRFSSLPILLSGQALLVTAALLAASSPVSGGAVFMTALFLLGLGWNFGFVAGSALLAVGVEPELRVRLQGFADSLVWISAATASFSSSLLLAAGSYRLLCLLGALLVTLPVTVIAARRRWLHPQRAT